VARVLLAVSDGAARAGGLGQVTCVRCAIVETRIRVSGLLIAILVTVVAQWFIGTVAHTDRGRFPIGSVDGALKLAQVMRAVGAVVFGVVLVLDTPLVPRSTPLSAILVALAVTAGMRLVVRRVRECADRPDEFEDQRVIIIGASMSGQQLLRPMLPEPPGGYLPVALPDDDPQRRRLRVSRVSGVGMRDDIPAVAQQTGVPLHVIAVSNVDAADVRDVTRRGTDAGSRSRCCLLSWDGTRSTTTSSQSLARWWGGRVLATRAGDSVGPELCRQINQLMAGVLGPDGHHQAHDAGHAAPRHPRSAATTATVAWQTSHRVHERGGQPGPPATPKALRRPPPVLETACVAI
jgi:FlaA1/EpsC-like NDP-sugar epimerase